LYRGHPQVATELARHNLGGPVSPATDRLIVDRDDQCAFAASAPEAAQFLGRNEDDASPGADARGRSRRPWQQRAAEEDMLAYLDGWRPPQRQ